MPVDAKEIGATKEEWAWLINWSDHRTDLLNADIGGTRWKTHWLHLQEWLETAKSICAAVQKLGLDGYVIKGISFGSDNHLRAKNQIICHLQFDKKNVGVKHIIVTKPII